jgi:hypothetical protein
MPLDLARGQTPGVERQHLVIEARQPPAPLGQQLRLKGAISVPRHLHIDLGGARLDPLDCPAVARVAAIPTGRSVLLVAEVIGHLTLERTLHQSLRQLIQQPVLPQDLLRRLALEQVIEHPVEWGLLLRHGTSQFRG